MQVRDFQDEDAPLLREIFRSAILRHAAADYDANQVAAWVANADDASAFDARMRLRRPLVALLADRPVGYADLQPDGLIDHFFVAGEHGRRGVGNALMTCIHAVARARGIDALRADVSRTAQGFFRRHGFRGEVEQAVEVRGVVLHNLPMHKRLRGEA